MLAYAQGLNLKKSGHTRRSKSTKTCFNSIPKWARAIPWTDVTNVTNFYTCSRASVFEFIISFVSFSDCSYFSIPCNVLFYLVKKIKILFIARIKWWIQNTKVIKFSQFQRHWLVLRKLKTVLKWSSKSQIFCMINKGLYKSKL